MGEVKGQEDLGLDPSSEEYPSSSSFSSSEESRASSVSSSRVGPSSPSKAGSSKQWCDFPKNEASIRVGGAWKSWRLGKVLLFDDSFEHEVRNDTDFHRTVLLMRFWHPDIDTPEKEQ